MGTALPDNPWVLQPRHSGADHGGFVVAKGADDGHAVHADAHEGPRLGANHLTLEGEPSCRTAVVQSEEGSKTLGIQNCGSLSASFHNPTPNNGLKEPSAEKVFPHAPTIMAAMIPCKECPTGIPRSMCSKVPARKCQILKRIPASEQHGQRSAILGFLSISLQSYLPLQDHLPHTLSHRVACGVRALHENSAGILAERLSEAHRSLPVAFCQLYSAARKYFVPCHSRNLLQR